MADNPPENRRSTETDPIIQVVQPIQIVQPVQTIETVRPVIVRVPEVIREQMEVPPVKENVTESEPKNSTPDNKKIIEPLNFSSQPMAPQAPVTGKMQYAGRDKGRQRKYYVTIALLEKHHAGDSRQWNKLDEQMQRYYRREYPEYFGSRDSKARQSKREENKVKATRIRHERLQREVKGAAPALSVQRTGPIDIQSRRSAV